MLETFLYMSIIWIAGLSGFIIVLSGMPLKRNPLDNAMNFGYSKPCRKRTTNRSKQMNYPIENVSGATVATGEGIAMFRLLSLKHAMKLEEKGLQLSRGGRWGAHIIAMRDMGMDGKATAKNRAIVRQKIADAISSQEYRLMRVADNIDNRN